MRLKRVNIFKAFGTIPDRKSALYEGSVKLNLVRSHMGRRSDKSQDRMWPLALSHGDNLDLAAAANSPGHRAQTRRRRKHTGARGYCSSKSVFVLRQWSYGVERGHPEVIYSPKM